MDKFENQLHNVNLGHIAISLTQVQIRVFQSAELILIGLSKLLGMYM